MRKEKLTDLISHNSEIFQKELTKVINPTFKGLENPALYEDTLHNILKYSNPKRIDFAAQALVECAAISALEDKKRKSIILSAEMGSGKTNMAVKISMSKKFTLNFIMCPPHLVDKWIDEINLAYSNEAKDSYKIIKVSNWRDLVPYTKNDTRGNGIKYYFIVSRETAKLTYPKVEVFKIKEKLIEQRKDIDGIETIVKSTERVKICPDCYENILEDEQVLLLKTPYKCPHCETVLRAVDKTKSKNLQQRISVSEYIKRTWTKGAIDLLIVDEIHEYKGGNTGQGNALAQMCSMSKKIIGLTGTLLNGYASSLFYVLYRIDPYFMKNTLKLEHHNVQAFIRRYGSIEATYEIEEINEEGIVTKKGRLVGAPKEKPRISPYLLSALLNNVIFLKLDEIKMEKGLGLPEYNETIELVELDEKLKMDINRYIEKIVTRARNDKSFLGALANDALAVADMPFQEHSARNEIFYSPEFERKDYGTTNKEKRLVELVKTELDNNRKVLVFIHFSNKGIAEDLVQILNKAFPKKKVNLLKATVKADERQAWIEENPCDILICNAELVKTGLDLLQYPTIIFYETTYNVFTLKQASRRSWRLGQKEHVKVIFMAYKNTSQHKALELIGRKVNAANSLEGRLSNGDDLSGFSEDDNIQVALAKAIMNKETVTNEIKLSNIKNLGQDREWNKFELWYRDELQNFKNSSNTKFVDIETIPEECFITDSNNANNTKEEIIVTLSTNDIKDENPVPVFNSLLEYDGEITSNKAYYYKTMKVGGRKVQERIEIDLDNLDDVLPFGSGIQLSLF